MDKINKLTFPATILIASIVLGGFYYASEVNKQKSIERQQQIKMEEQKVEKCIKASQQLYDQIIIDVEKEGSVVNYDHENYYNKKLNTCFLSYGYAYGGVIARYVKDVYTNKTILFYGRTDHKDWDISYDEYEKQRKELFSQ